MSVTGLEPEVEEWVGRLVALTGESENEAIRLAVQERVNRLAPEDRKARTARILAFADEMAAYPVLDERSSDEIIGYNEFGAFD